MSEAPRHKWNLKDNWSSISNVCVVDLFLAPFALWINFDFIAFITGNSSLEPLLEGLLSQIHTDLSSRFSAGIEPGTCR